MEGTHGARRRPRLPGLTVNWEMVAWLAIVVLALVSRLWQLGDRAMSHDESLHTFYSWKLYIGEGYQHDPMMHGPLLYHLTALSYFLFGVNDFTARLPAVVAGLGLVLSPLLLRKWLGRVGAIATAVMLLASPTVMYYSRYIRHDILVELFTALMVVSFFRYLDSHNGRWVVVAFAAAAGGITSAEMSYINGFVLVVFIVLALAAERLGRRGSEGLAVGLGAVGLGLLVFALVAATGTLGNVSEKGLPLRTAMQLGFLIGGLGLVYSFGVGLLARFRTAPGRPAAGLAPDTLAALTADRFFPRYRDPKTALLPVVSGLALLAFGWAVTAYRVPPGGQGYGPLRLLMWLGAAVLIYGLAALVLGPLTAAWGRRTNPVLAGVGLAVAILGWAVWKTGAMSPVTAEGAAATEAGTLAAGFPPALVVALAGVVLLAYGILGWVLEDHEERGLARAVGQVPLDALAVGLAVAVVTYVLFFTTFFTAPQRITGLLDSISYWLKQHEVVRGDQPWYYYAIFTPTYEFVPLGLALAAMWLYARRPQLRVGSGNDGPADNPSPAARCFVPLLATWSAGNFWIYSWAGEKMPWLLVHLVVPLTFLAGRLVADLVAAVDWGAVRARNWRIGALFVLLLLVGVAWLSQQPSRGQTAEELQSTIGWLLGLPVVALLVWGLVRVAAEAEGRQARLVVAATLALVLFVLNVRYSLLANFVNDELATEYIVYAHGTPDDKLVYNMLRDMQQRLGVDEPLTIAYDNEVSWPFTWYFRRTDWVDARYIGENPTGAMTEDAVLVGSPNYSRFEPYLRDRYVSIEYRRMWWPNEGYKHLTLEKLWTAVVDPRARRNWLRILLYREYTVDPMAEMPEPKSLTDWYHHANMRLYLKKDLIRRLWPLATARPEWLAEVELGPQEGPPVAQLSIEQRYDTGPDGKPLVEPKDIAVAPDGTLYVVDHRNGRIVVFGPDGQATGVLADGELVVLGDPKAEPSAWGVGLGPAGEVYVADTWNHRVLRYVDGVLDLSWGQFGQPSPDAPLEGPMNFYGPRDVAIGPDGNIYVTDTGNKRINVFDQDGRPLRSFGGEGIEPGRFNEPTALAFDPATGDLFVADLWNLRVQRFDRELNFVTAWTVDGWDSKEAAHKAYLAVGPGSTVVVSDPAGARVWVYDNQGTLLTTLDLLQDPQGLEQPVGVAVDGEGRIYVASSTTGLVTRYGPPEALLEAAGLASPEAEEAPAEEGGGAAAEEQGQGAAQEVGQTEAEPGGVEGGVAEEPTPSP